MAETANKLKITQISKDFSMKSQDVLEKFKTYGMEKKSGGTVESAEFEVFLARLSNENQIQNLDDYLDGKVKLSIVKDETAPKPAAPKAEAPKAEAPKPEAPKAEAPKAAPQAAPKPQPKPAPKAEAPKADAPKPGAVYTFRPNGDDNRSRSVSFGGDNRGQNRPQQQGGYNGNRPQGQGNRPQNGYNNNNRSYGGYASSSDDPFAKRRNDMLRGSVDYQVRNAANTAAQNRPKNDTLPAQKRMEEQKRLNEQRQAEAKRLEEASNALRAKQNAAQQSDKAAAKAAPAAKPAAPAPKKEEKKKPAQKQAFKTITQTVDPSTIRGGVNLDVSSYEQTSPKTRVVDMRTSDVNLSKYDDRYNDQFLAIARGTDNRAPMMQKLKKQDNKGQNQKSAKDKERAAAERMKRQIAEQARKKQLEVTCPEEITVSDLAARFKKTAAELVKKLMLMGEMKGMNDVIDYSTAEFLAEEFGIKISKEIVITIEERLFEEAEDASEDLVERAPVVCVMGHVDHGKTSILDAIRHTNVTRGEAGGITQAIGAYRVKAGNDKDITFLDTPGHEAFTAMRMRGAQSTDIAILVVAADDGVMPQTVEAINHAKAAGIDIIVAINKMDKPQANPDNVLNQLTQYELVPEAWGGDVICVPCSAHTGMGIQDLLESVLLVAEVKELKANPNRRAKGLVLESRLDKGCGPVATILVQNGTLHQGDYVIVGNAVGRVRLMKDDKGRAIKVAGPSVPVEITGLDDVPQAGDELNAVEDERMAKSLADQRREKQRQDILTANARVNLDDLFQQISDGVKTLNVVVKADVAGSAEAVKASLMKLSSDEVKVSVIHSAVGGIIESDVMLAAASNAIIVGFNVRPDKNALDSAERNGVDIRTHRIIYEIIDEIEAAMKGMLAPTFQEVLLGHAEVRQTIHVPNVGTIAGSYVLDGKVARNSKIRVVRDGIVIFEDEISSLRRFKDDVKEVAEGYECGIGLAKFNDIKEGDTLESFVMQEVAK